MSQNSGSEGERLATVGGPTAKISGHLAMWPLSGGGGRTDWGQPLARYAWAVIPAALG